MLIAQIQKEPSVSFNYLERLVNDGSPSGFDKIHTTSKQTNPLYSEEFNVKKLNPTKGEVISRGSCDSGDIVSPEDSYIYIHPDWESKGQIIFSLGEISDGTSVVPTSSFRTVRVKGTNRFLKLHYPDLIGRLQRNLGDLQLSYAIEINNILNEAKRSATFPCIFDYMPEYYGRVLKCGDTEIGFVCREMPLYDDAKYYIPAFSLFSADQHNSNDERLLIQLLQVHKDNPHFFFLNDICFPLIDIFFYCVHNLGLIPEMHSQNIVFLFDADWKTKKVLLRDFESIDMDTTIREELGFKDKIECPPNKALSVTNKYYRRRYSFMFDHKLCEYLIDPLVRCALSALNCDEKIIVQHIKEYYTDKYGERSKDFFPQDGCWYKYPNTEIDRSTSDRPYISQGKAKYR